MAKRYDVVATTGTYEKEGQKKYINRNVGAVLETQHGLSLVMDASFNPAGCPISEDGKVWLKLFEPKDENQQKPAQQPRENRSASAPAQSNYDQFGDMDSEIPF